MITETSILGRSSAGWLFFGLNAFCSCVLLILFSPRASADAHAHEGVSGDAPGIGKGGTQQRVEPSDTVRVLSPDASDKTAKVSGLAAANTGARGFTGNAKTC